MESKVRFRVIGFDHENEQYILITHDGLVDADKVSNHNYGVENIDTLMYDGPKTWANELLNDIKEALSDIEVNYLTSNIRSPCYLVDDTRMVCNTYTVIINNFNKYYNAIQFDC